MVARTLITTANEYTWPEDKKQPVLFLGEWCKLYGRKEVWRHLDIDVAPYHWDDRKKLYEDYQYLQKIYENLLAELSENLNQIHSTDHSLRYWRILVGPWLGYFIQMLFDRWFMLKQAIEQAEIVGCRIIDRNPLSVVPNDMAHFNTLFIEDDWNESIYGQLLELCWDDEVSIERIRVGPVGTGQAGNANRSLITDLKEYVKKWITIYNKLLPSDDGYFFISSYLPLKTDIKLQMRLGQFPKLWRSYPAPVIRADLQKRQWWLEGKISVDDSFNAIARQLIPLHIPTTYLEGYEQLVTVPDLLAWPKKPKAIFTSNAYLADEIFKTWVAEKTESGVTLVIGQHGGHFGMNPFAFHEEHQITIADKWLSWGWSDQAKPQITPIGNFKNIGRTVEYDPKGGALMVEMSIPRYSYHLYATPISRQWLDYLSDQKRFLQCLPCKLREQVLIRLYQNDYGWDQTARWKDEMPEMQLDRGRQNIHKLIKLSRLYISTYNATTYLESLSSNIPTIIFWNSNHWELKKEVVPFFELLKSVGVFHETPESAAQQMIKVWDDVAAWWESDEVQNNRKIFCHQFARMPDDSIGELQSFFEEISNEHGLSASG